MKASSSLRGQRQQQAISLIRSVCGQHGDEVSLDAAMEQSMLHRQKAREDGTSSEADASLTYGEVVPAEFMKIVDTYRKLAETYGARVESGGVFVDVGSGRGLPSLCAALSDSGFSLVWGIEIMPELVEISNQLAERVKAALAEDAEAKPQPSSATAAAASSPPPAEQLADHIRLLLQEAATSPSGTLRLESLADILCKRIGHKRYKALLKGHKSLQRYLAAFPDHFSLHASDNSVSLLSKEEAPPVATVPANDPPSRSVHRPATSLLRTLRLPEIQFEHADGFQVDWWRRADVVYAASLLFSEPMLRALTDRVAQMQTGTWFIGLRRLPLDLDAHPPHRRVVLRHESFFRMSWQMANVYFYQVSDYASP